MKNILVATDLAVNTYRALERAALLAKASGAKLHILHVAPAYHLSNQKKPHISLKKEAESIIKNWLSACRDAKGLKYSVTVIEGGDAFTTILSYAEKVRANLIVMGMHGKADFRDLFIGTTIERVIRKSVRPVLMVKDKPAGAYKSVLVGTDFSAGSKQALHMAAGFTPGGTFNLVHIYNFPDTDIGDKIEQFSGKIIKKIENDKLKKFGKENHKFLKNHGIPSKKINLLTIQGPVYGSIIRESKRHKSDLIAIGVHSRVDISLLKLGGTAEDLLANPPCDVLIAHGSSV